MRQKSKIDELDDKDEPIREILGNVPRWIIMWGNTIVLIFFVCLLALSFIIQYPDVVNSNAKLTSINPPKPILSLISGKLIKLKVDEGQEVRANNIIGFVESRADHEEVIKLATVIDSVQSFLESGYTEEIPYLLSKPYHRLGEVQPFYQTFMQGFSLFSQYLNNGYYIKKKAMLLEDIGYMQRLHANLQKQKEIEIEDLGLADSTFKMNQQMYTQKIIPQIEYQNERSRYLIKALTIPQINSSMVSNENTQHEKQKEILQLTNDITQQKNAFSQILNTFKAQLQDWKSKFVLTSPISGKVVFANFIQENQQIQSGQIICFVNPIKSSFYAEMYIPQYNFGKVAIGQRVLLKFPAYPYQEFGTVYGNIDFISRIPTDSGYLAKVILTNGLVTNYKKQIQYREGLLAQGEIITKEMRLIQRLLQQLISAFEKT